MAEDQSTYQQRQEQLRREAERREDLLNDRKAQIVEVHGGEIGKRVAAYGAEDEVSQAAVGIVAERIAKTTLNVENFDAQHVNIQVEQRRIGEAVDEAYRKTTQPEHDEALPQQSNSQQAELGAPAWKERAETAERQHGQNQRYDELKSLSSGQPDVQSPPEVQQTEAQRGDQKRDRVTDFLEAEKLDREARKAKLQELAREYGHEITAQQGHDISRSRGNGHSL